MNKPLIVCTGRLAAMLAVALLASLPGRTNAEPMSQAELERVGKSIAESARKARALIDEMNGGKVKEYATLRAHTAGVWTLAFSPDGKYLASGSRDMRVCVWNVERKEKVWALEGHRDEVTCVAFQPNGHLLASAGFDGVVCLWDVRTGKLVRLIRREKAVMLSVRFSPDGTRLAMGGDNHFLGIWDIARGKVSARLNTALDRVNCLQFSPDGAVLVATGSTSNVEFWEVKEGRLNQTLTTQEGSGFAIDSKWTTLARGVKGLSVSLYELPGGQLTKTIGGSRDSAAKSMSSECAFSPDGVFLAITDSSMASVYTARDGGIYALLASDAGPFRCVDFASSGNLVAAGDINGAVVIWQLYMPKSWEGAPASDIKD